MRLERGKVCQWVGVQLQTMPRKVYSLSRPLPKEAHLRPNLSLDFSKEAQCLPGIANHLPKEVRPLLDDADGSSRWSPAADICEWGGGGAQDQVEEGVQPAGEARK